MLLEDNDRFLKSAVRAMLYALVAAIVLLMVIVLQTPLGAIWRQLFDSIWGLAGGHVTWYVTRASGLVAYVLLWLSMVWGLGVSTKFFDRIVPRAFTYDAHEYISLLALGFTFIHIVVLLWDAYEPFSAAQLFIPFVSNYRPFWIGVGILGTYVTLLVTVTFYLRKWIGIRAFRAIHWLSFLAFVGVIAHSWFAGTDTNLALVQWMYFGTAFVVIAMTAVWLLKPGLPAADKRPAPPPQPTIAVQTTEQPFAPSRFGVETISVEEFKRRNNIS